MVAPIGRSAGVGVESLLAGLEAFPGPAHWLIGMRDLIEAKAVTATPPHRLELRGLPSSRCAHMR
jgi:hypothetical protein